jgi:hypothetical protein
VEVEIASQTPPNWPKFNELVADETTKYDGTGLGRLLEK